MDRYKESKANRERKGMTDRHRPVEFRSTFLSLIHFMDRVGAFIETDQVQPAASPHPLWSCSLGWYQIGNVRPGNPWVAMADTVRLDPYRQEQRSLDRHLARSGRVPRILPATSVLYTTTP